MSSPHVGVEERYAVFPFYLCLDVSASMAGEPIDGVNRQLPALRSAIGEDPAIAEVIRFGVVTFSDVARTVLPLCDLSMVEAMPHVGAEGRTSYGAAFDHLRRTIEGDYQAGRATGDRWYRPAVVFISDGQPTDDPSDMAGGARAGWSTRSGNATRTCWLSASGQPRPMCWPR